MKKRLFALACAIVMTLGMSTTVMAAELSPSAGSQDTKGGETPAYSVMTINEEATPLEFTVPEENVARGDVFTAPQTGEANMTVVVMLATACLATAIYSGKKLKTNN